MNNNYQIIKKEVINAYSDCNNYSKEDRQLDFLASQYVSSKEAQEIMSLAIDGGYNNFTSDLLSILPINARVWLAREGSVCLYLDIPIDEEIRKNLNCDEYDQITEDVLKYQPNMTNMIGTYRVWWD